MTQSNDDKSTNLAAKKLFFVYKTLCSQIKTHVAFRGE